MKVISVEPLPSYKLKVSFDDDVSGIIDLSSFVQNGIFSVLQDEKLFAEVKFNQSTIFWNEELEIDLLNIYLEISGKNFDELFPKAVYSSN